MSLARRYQKLYRKIPGMVCIPGCHACCKGATASRYELSLLPPTTQRAHGPDMIHPCPHVSKEGCSVRDRRPFVCQMFGVVESMSCPKGMNSVFLSAEKEAELREEFRKLVCLDGKEEVFLL